MLSNRKMDWTNVNFTGCLQFLARDSMLSALYAIARLSVCHKNGSVKNC